MIYKYIYMYKKKKFNVDILKWILNLKFVCVDGYFMYNYV